MNPLVSRKKLLIAESELNRAQLARDWQNLTDDVHALAGQANTLCSLASAATTLLSGWLASRREAAAPDAEKTSWLQKILKGAQLAGSLWSEFRAPKN
jgi:HPt (histidine-containing phosphotransfer) domain-containing protein